MLTSLEFVHRRITATLPHDHNIRASMLMLLAILLGGGMSICIRALGDDFSPFQIVFSRSLVLLAVLLPLLLRTGLRVLKTDRPLMVIARALSGFMGQIFGVLAIINLPLAEFQAIGFTKAFLVSLLGLVFLQEALSRLRWAAIAIGFSGTLIIVQPQTGLNGFALFALANALCFSISTILVKILLRTHSRRIMMTHAALLQCLFASIPTLFVFQMPGDADWIWFVLMGAIALCVQPLMLAAYRIGEVSRLAPVDFTRLLVAALIGFFLFQEVPSLVFWFGAVLIILANLLVLRDRGGPAKSQFVQTN